MTWHNPLTCHNQSSCRSIRTTLTQKSQQVTNLLTTAGNTWLQDIVFVFRQLRHQWRSTIHDFAFRGRRRAASTQTHQDWTAFSWRTGSLDWQNTLHDVIYYMIVHLSYCITMLYCIVIRFFLGIHWRCARVKYQIGIGARHYRGNGLRSRAAVLKGKADFQMGKSPEELDRVNNFLLPFNWLSKSDGTYFLYILVHVLYASLCMTCVRLHLCTNYYSYPFFCIQSC